MNTQNDTNAENKQQKIESLQDELSRYKRNVPPWGLRAGIAVAVLGLTAIILWKPVWNIYSSASEKGAFSQVQLGFLIAALTTWALVVLGSFWFLKKLR